MVKETGHLKPTKNQLDRLARHGYQGSAPQTRNEYLAIWQDLEPPSDGQIEYLRILGYNGPKPTSKKQASRLIEGIVGKKTDMVSAGDAWLRTCVFPAVSKLCSDLNEMRKR